MNEVGVKWDCIYRENEPGRQTPAPVLAENAYLLPPKGRALDLACGLGANAIFLAERGFTVTALDISSVAIDKIQAHAGQHGLATSHRPCFAADLRL